MAFKFNPFTGNLDLVSEETPGGSTGAVQFNDAGSFAGSNLTYDKVTGRFTFAGEVLLISPNSTQYKLTVTNDGILQVSTV